jgi:hypothetical protein
MIPVLTPLLSDYPEIIRSLAHRITRQLMQLDPSALQLAGEVFFRKRASPRDILGALRSVMVDSGEITDEAVVRAAEDLCLSPDGASTEYADLWAIRACPNKRYYPWYQRETSYPFPDHLQGILIAGSDLNVEELDRRIEELKPHANV